MIAPSVALLALGALAVRAQQATELDLQYAQVRLPHSALHAAWAHVASAEAARARACVARRASVLPARLDEAD
jgi:hypothetical protein